MPEAGAVSAFVAGLIVGLAAGVAFSLSWGIAEGVKLYNPQADITLPLSIYFGFFVSGALVGGIAALVLRRMGRLPEPPGYPFPAAPIQVQIALRRMRSVIEGGE